MPMKNKLTLLLILTLFLAGCTNVNKIAYNKLIDRQVEQDTDKTQISEEQEKEKYMTHEEYVQEREIAKENMEQENQ